MRRVYGATEKDSATLVLEIVKVIDVIAACVEPRTWCCLQEGSKPESLIAVIQEQGTLGIDRGGAQIRCETVGKK